MTKNKRRLYFSLFLLVALIGVAYLTAKKSGWFNDKVSSGEMPQSNFIVEDTASIDRLVIIKSTGEKAELTRNDKGQWMINNKYRAKPASVTLLLKTIKQVKVASRVGVAARNGVIRNIAAYHRKVQIYSNGEWVKTWYVGNPTSDRRGTYILLETPEEGKSENPYIMDLTRFHGQLDTRFFTDETEWRYTGIFEIQPEKLKEVKFTSREKPNDGFTMKLTPKRKIELYDWRGGKINGFDTLTARAYTYGFKTLHYEHLAQRLTYEMLDSMKKTTPFYSLTVTETNNNTTKVDFYQMRNFDKIVDLEGKEYEWNPTRLYAILPSGEAAVVQYYSFDKVFRTAESFAKPPAPAAPALP